ncbi:MAG: AbrB/MazE/SpoVT family DNA-binding domain-containing protein [Acetobacteraceae bacterium]
MTTTVTAKGQITIPKAVRERLGIGPGNAVDFELGADRRVTLVKAGAGLSTDEIMALTRGDDAA